MRQSMDDAYPRLSIVIPALNEERFIAQTIHFLLNQDYPSDKVEILVVVADSVDGTEEAVKRIAASDSRVKFLRNPYKLSSRARTLGAQAATGEIILFIDGHVYIDNPRLFQSTARLMKERQVSILSRPQFMDTPYNSRFQRAVSLARKSWIGHGSDSTTYLREAKYVDPTSSGASYRKEVFEKVGYFDPAFDACEDVEFNYRCAEAGFRSFISMDLAVYYYPRATLPSLFHQMMRYGIGRFRLVRKHPKILSVPTLFPALLILSPFLIGLFSLTWPMLAVLLSTLVLAYLLVVLLFAIILAARNGWIYSLLLPAVYLTIHSGLGWGFLRELASRTFRILLFGANPRQKS